MVTKDFYTAERSKIPVAYLFNFWNGVDPNAIEVKLIDQVLDPFDQLITNVWVVLVKVWKSRKPAVLDLLVVIEVADAAKLIAAWHNMTNIIQY